MRLAGQDCLVSGGLEGVSRRRRAAVSGCSRSRRVSRPLASSQRRPAVIGLNAAVAAAALAGGLYADAVRNRPVSRAGSEELSPSALPIQVRGRDNDCGFAQAQLCTIGDVAVEPGEGSSAVGRQARPNSRRRCGRRRSRGIERFEAAEAELIGDDEVGRGSRPHHRRSSS